MLTNPSLRQADVQSSRAAWSQPRPPVLHKAALAPNPHGSDARERRALHAVLFPLSYSLLLYLYLYLYLGALL
jgi:hypothetical protein